MDTTTLQKEYETIIREFGLTDIPEEERGEIIMAIAEAIQRQFLYSVHKAIDKEQFSALEASASMGSEFYATTLKHILPGYEDLFKTAREKVAKAAQTELLEKKS